MIIENWPELEASRPTAITIGNFDGLHLGHQKIIDKLVSFEQLGLQPILLSFHPHPRALFNPGKSMGLLTTVSEKLEMLQKWPLLPKIVHFNEDLASLEPEKFIQEILLKRLKGKKFVLGQNHRFGKSARGDARFLKEVLGDDDSVNEIFPVEIDNHQISSSTIRNLLQKGELAQANRMLGYSFNYSGIVQTGEGRGKKLGFPTANLEVEPAKLQISPGVYGAIAKVEKKSYQALVNIGHTPTFPSQARKIEAHLLNFQGNLYGQIIKLELFFHLRKEMRFHSESDLKTSIRKDIREYKERMASILSENYEARDTEQRL